MTSMTPNPDQNAVQSPVQDSAAQQGGTTQPSGAQRSARSLMNSLYRSPRARKNGAPDAEDTVPLAISTEVTPAEAPAEETPAEPAASQPESNGWADWDQQPDWNEVDDWAEWEQADQPGTTRSTRWGLSPRVLLLVAVLALVAVVWGVTQFSAAPRAEQVASPSTSPSASAESVQAVGAQQSPGAQPGTQSTAQPGANPSESAQGGGASGETTVRVHVAGAVNNPGVYTLPAQGRAVDAIAAASGAAADADLDRVNLAGALSDGVQIYVPHRGETAAPAQIQPNGGTANAGQANAANGASQGGTQPQPARTLIPAGSAQKGSTPVNINTATAEELQTLPRIGPAMAQRIIAWREAHGGFRSVDELDAVPGIGPSMLENLRPLVTV
ncbi:competence protein ComEA [Rothia sp. HMSC073B08]|uniref:ComEA family DNA-binding protein n=1 Tax=Rothia sp. HMSC073B08 TaxID=1739388 RepID=UPI0008A6622F|nr:helix-hairpin-helix domain-containing protein [Rothia sp. HMSC073B08]OFR47749.1 competence protein ComEA [Rothia sp. HMSC073B08]